MARICITSLSYVSNKGRIDPGFFQDQFVDLDKKLHNSLPISSIADTVDLQSNGAFRVIFNILNDRNIRQVPYIRSTNVGYFFINTEDLHFISKEAHIRLPKTHTKSGDILMARKGKIGGATLIFEEDEGFNSNDNVVNVRLHHKDILPEYFVTFWNSRFGLMQIERFATGNVQPWLSMKQIRQLRTVCLKREQQEEIKNIVRSAYDAFLLSKSLYNEAQQLLVTELGLDRLNPQKPVGYTARFSEILGNNRADAEFYHIKYAPFLDVVRSYKNGWLPLKEITKQILPSLVPNKLKGNFCYIEIGDINIRDGSYSFKHLSAEQLPANAIMQVYGGEILISKVRPTRGAIAILEEYMPPNSLCSGAFYVCTVNDKRFREAVWLYLRSMKNVYEKYCGGTSYPTIESKYLANFPVPLFDLEIAKEISRLVISARNAHQESKNLLDLATTRVEHMIEEAVQNETLA